MLLFCLVKSYTINGSLSYPFIKQYYICVSCLKNIIVQMKVCQIITNFESVPKPKITFRKYLE